MNKDTRLYRKSRKSGRFQLLVTSAVMRGWTILTSTSFELADEIVRKLNDGFIGEDKDYIYYIK